MGPSILCYGMYHCPQTRVADAVRNQDCTIEILILRVNAWDCNRAGSRRNCSGTTVPAVLQNEHLIRWAAKLRGCTKLHLRVWLAMLNIIPRQNEREVLFPGNGLKQDFDKFPTTACRQTKWDLVRP